MGTYVYSLRKRHKEVLIDGIYPVDVIPLQYAYRWSDPWPGSPGYAEYSRMVGRAGSLAEKACDHHHARNRAEFGTDERHNYVVVTDGDRDWNEGNAVYKLPVGFLPELWADSGSIHKDAEHVGYLFKLDRTTWAVLPECPGHTWKGGASLGDFRPGYTRWWDAETCTRCGKGRYTDPEMRALKEEYERQCELRATYTYDELVAMQAAA